MADQLTVAQFSQAVKSRMPQLANVPDEVLTRKILQRRPELITKLSNPPQAPAQPKELGPESTSESLGRYPGRILDRMSENIGGMAKLPGQVMNESRESFKKSPGSPLDAIRAMSDSITGAAGGAAKGIGSTTSTGIPFVQPGIFQRMQSEPSENIAGDAAMSFIPGAEEALPKSAIEPTKAGSFRGSATRGKSLLDRVELAAKDIPVNHQPAYQWAQKAMALENQGYTIPKPIKDFVAWIDSKSKPGMDSAGSAKSFIDRGGQMNPLDFEASRNFEKSLGEKIPWEQDQTGVMNGFMKKIRESLGQENAVALKPHGLDVPYLKGKAEFAKSHTLDKYGRIVGKVGGKIAGYGTGLGWAASHAGGEVGKGIAGSMVDSVVNAGGKE